MSAKSIPTTDLKNIFSFYIQTEPLEEWHFKMLVTPPAPPGVHGAKFNIRELHDEDCTPLRKTSQVVKTCDVSC